MPTLLPWRPILPPYGSAEPEAHRPGSSRVMALTRRQLLSLVGSLPLTVACARHAWAQTASRVVVVGGGFGGATCAKYLRRADATLDVTLVEPHRQFVTC